jgi:3-dehydroquinate synthase II
MEFTESKVKEIVEMGEGTRVEIDLIDMLSESEGVLVGDSAVGYVCVLAETRATETYPPRPFRVNAGAVHQYTHMYNGETKYLSELSAGDVVCVTDGHNTRGVTVGRVKIEKRPFVRVVCESGITATVQKADSIYLASNKGAAHLLDIKVGDMVLNVVSENIARHKGKAIEEMIIEK